MVNLKSIKDYEEILENARTNSISSIIPNDNIMNTYCVLNYMLKNCSSIQIYCGEARLFTKNGEARLKEIADKDSVNYLYEKMLSLLTIFLANPQKQIEIISEREPAEIEDKIKSILDKKNFSVKILRDKKIGNFEYHFMVGDFSIYRRETNDKSKNGIVKIAYQDKALESCRVLRTAFQTIDNEILVKKYC